MVNLRKMTIIAILIAFIVEQLFPANVRAQTVPALPVPGSMLRISESFQPAIISGLTVHPDNPLKFDFLIDAGNSAFEGDELKAEAQKMINYFLTTLTVPDEEMWVNLSPYEKDRIIADGLARTEMGRDMLMQDYLLKQLTASLMYPEGEVGKNFWEKVHEKIYQEQNSPQPPLYTKRGRAQHGGVTDSSYDNWFQAIDTFNKVWIVPESASVYIHDNTVFVVNSHLKVMLEEDYLAQQQSVIARRSPPRFLADDDEAISEMASQKTLAMTEETKTTIRSIILPVIEEEVNHGKTFANLRQIYNSMLLATWYKRNLKESLLGRAYINQNKVDGIDLAEDSIKEKIYNQYVESFKVGVYDYVKEEYDPQFQQMIPRKYFSGGLTRFGEVGVTENIPDVAQPDVAYGVELQPQGKVSEAMLQPKTYAVTGATGAVGTQLIRQLLIEGDLLDVDALKKLIEPSDAVYHLNEGDPDKAMMNIKKFFPNEQQWNMARPIKGDTVIEAFRDLVAQQLEAGFI